MIRRVLRGAVATLVALLLVAIGFTPAYADPTGGTVTGTVRDVVEETIAGATVSLYVISDGEIDAVADTTSNEFGVYTFEDVAPGTYGVSFAADNKVSVYRNGSLSASDPTSLFAVEIGKTVTSDVHLYLPGVIAGEIAGPGKTAVGYANVLVTLAQYDPSSSWVSSQTMYLSEGESYSYGFFIPADGGRYRVTFSTTTEPYASVAATSATVRVIAGNILEVNGWMAKTRAGSHFSTFADMARSNKFFGNAEWMYKEGISSGTNAANGSRVYRPETVTTRGQMAAFLYRLADPDYTAPSTATFTDVPTTHKFFREIEWLASEGITGGTGGSLFQPSGNISRGAMSAFLFRMVGPSFVAPTTPSFTDVPTSNKFYREIEWLKEAGIAVGIAQAGGTYRFAPNSLLNRGAMAAFLQRYDDAYGVDPE